MSTMIVPEAAPGGPTPEPAYTGEGLRFVPIHANLLPEEVVAARRARTTRKRMGIGLGALAALLVVWFGFAKFQTAGARGDLEKAQAQSVTLQNTVRSYAPLVTAQSQSAAIQKSLQRLMAGDIQWVDLLATLQRTARGGITVTTVSGTVDDLTDPTAPAAVNGYSVLNQSGEKQVGTLTVTGSAPDKNSVAAYIDALASVKGLTAPFPANVAGQRGQVTFTATILITADALGGRFAPAAQPAAQPAGRPAAGAASGSTAGSQGGR